MVKSDPSGRSETSDTLPTFTLLRPYAMQMDHFESLVLARSEFKPTESLSQSQSHKP